jgi:uncharacterized RDD family membrane protein YckC
MTSAPRFCQDCGAPVRDNSRFCAACGAPVTPPAAPATERASPTPEHLAWDQDRTEVITGPVTARAEPPTQRTPTPPYASIGQRLLGQVVDGLIALGIFAIIGALVANRSGDPTANGFNLTGVPALIVIGITSAAVLLYFFLAEALTGMTIGKLAAGMRVQSTDSSSIGFAASLIRNLLRLIDGVGGYLIGGIVALTSPRRQRLGDMAAGTVVLRRPTAAGLRLGAALAAVLVAAAGIGGCRLVREPFRAEPAINATLARSVNAQRQPVDQTTTFDQTQETIYLTFAASHARPGAELRAVWTAVNVGAVAPPNTVIDEARLTLERGSESGVFTLRRSGSRWAPGEYRAELYLDGRLVQSLPYTIAGTPAAAPTPMPPTIAARTATTTSPRTPTATAVRTPTSTATATRPGTATATPRAAAPTPAPPGPQTGGPLTVTLAAGVTSDYQPVRPATTFSPTTERIYAAFKATGAGRGAVVKTVWTAVAVNSPDLPDTRLDEAAVTLPQGEESGAFNIRRTSPTWPVGDYKVEFFVNDRLVLTIPYRVAP